MASEPALGLTLLRQCVNHWGRNPKICLGIGKLAGCRPIAKTNHSRRNRLHLVVFHDDHPRDRRIGQLSETKEDRLGHPHLAQVEFGPSVGHRSDRLSPAGPAVFRTASGDAILLVRFLPEP